MNKILTLFVVMFTGSSFAYANSIQLVDFLSPGGAAAQVPSTVPGAQPVETAPQNSPAPIVPTIQDPTPPPPPTGGMNNNADPINDGDPEADMPRNDVGVTPTQGL